MSAFIGKWKPWQVSATGKGSKPNLVQADPVYSFQVYPGSMGEQMRCSWRAYAAKTPGFRLKEKA
jgi:hypothetical protein